MADISGLRLYAGKNNPNLTRRETSQVFPNGSMGSRCTYNSYIVFENTGTLVSNDSSALFSLIQTIKLYTGGIYQRSELTIGWNNSKTGSNIWGSNVKNAEYIARYIQPVSGYREITDPNTLIGHSYTNAKFALPNKNPNNVFISGILSARFNTYESWTSMKDLSGAQYAKWNVNQRGSRSTSVLLDYIITNQCKTVGLGNLTVNINTYDDARDCAQLIAIGGNDNTIIINIDGNLVVNHNEGGDDKNFAIVYVNGSNNNIIINITGSFKYQVSGGTGGSALYAMATNDTNSNKITVINTDKINTNVAFRYLIGDKNKPIHVSARNNDNHEGAKIYQGYQEL